MSESEPLAGTAGLQRVAEYELEEVIGRGAAGTVHRARSLSTGECVALKMLHGGASEEALARFSREVAIAQQLLHRHVVSVLDAGLDDGTPYLVMELLRGQSVHDMLREHPDGLDVDAALDIVAQVCLGLHHAHEQGLVHRDVKPANVFVTREGVAKVLDFGVAKLSDTTVTASGSLVGTLAFMAPEQLLSRTEIDGRADVFSAAVILYLLLTGRRPFEGDTAQATLAQILSADPAPLPARLPGVERLQALVDRGLAKDPARRFPTAQAFAHALWATRLDTHVRAASPDGPPADAPVDGSPRAGDEVTMASASRMPVAPAPEAEPKIDAVRPEPSRRWMYMVLAAGVGLLLASAVAVMIWR